MRYFLFVGTAVMIIVLGVLSLTCLAALAPWQITVLGGIAEAACGIALISGLADALGIPLSSR